MVSSIFKLELLKGQCFLGVQRETGTCWSLILLISSIAIAPG